MVADFDTFVRIYMVKVKVFYDQEGNTLTVWFADPQDEYVCEETGDEVVSCYHSFTKARFGKRGAH